MPAATVEARMRRLLALLGWLSRQPTGTARISDLAARFDMDEKEVVSELELAACCGLPPYSPDQLMELMVDDQEVQARLGPELSRPRRLSPAEGFTLAASARALLAVPGADPEGSLASALAKLEAVLGQRGQVEVDLDEPPCLGEVRRAAEEAERIRIEYYSASRDEVSRRDVDPYHVFSSGGHWYLEAWCHRASDLRHFRVDRVESVLGLGQRFDPPARGPRQLVVAPGPDAPLARICLPGSARALVESLPLRSLVEEADGSLTVELPVGGQAWLARLLLRAGPGSRVLEPDWLAGTGSAAARRILARYA